MEYLLILFVVALALAPLSHFFPGKHQRLVARMRERAAVSGLFVEFRELPDAARSQAAGAARNTRVIYYGKRLPPSRDRARPKLSWLPSSEGWMGLGHREPAPSVAQGLPDSIHALGMDEGSCGVYWLEQGDEADVDKVVIAVKAWAEALAGRP